MTSATTTHFVTDSVRPPRLAFLRPGWQLTWLFVPFPLWWVLGLGHFIFFISGILMARELLKRRPVFAPMAFGLWLLFSLVVIAGIPLLWVQPGGTLPGHGVSRLLPYVYHASWYIAITVVSLYVLNMPERDLSSERIMRLLALMFIYTVAGGYAGLLLPHVDFPSLMELILPIPRTGFINTLVHPSLATSSEFLGYQQPRPSAPFSFPNAWGNNLGMYLPFFVAAWLGRNAGRRRPFGIAILALAIVPIAYSLNRGLWIGLFVALVAVAVKLATMGHIRVLQITAAVLAVAVVIFISTPLYATVVLRVNTPDSNARRGTLAHTVISKTTQLSPLLGYGETRAVSGSFDSIAGGETPDCHQCAAPPLGTQGFMWRLIFTTGLFGTLFFLGYVGAQLGRFGLHQDPVAVTCCIVLLLTITFSFVYDSLESPLFTAMIAIGLLNRRYIRDAQLASTTAESEPVPAPAPATTPTPALVGR